MATIHPTALVDPTARLAEDVVIGPYTIVEAEVELGPGCRVGAHVTLGARLRLGAGVTVYNYACLGTASQDLKHRGERSHAEIGDGSIVREFVTVNRATREGEITRVGRGVLLMAYSHVAHACVVGDGAIIVNGATLGGEVHIGARANIGGLVGIHQFCRVGALAIVGSNSKVTQDIPPYVVADGHPARPFGPNAVGLRRAGWSEGDILEVRRIYRELYDHARSRELNVSAVAERFAGNPRAEAILAFISNSRRGLAHPRARRDAFSDPPAAP